MGTIIVTDQTTIREGEKNGRAWHLRRVYATREDGSPIENNLKTFDDLPMNQPIEVEFEEGEYKGTKEYLLKDPNSKPSRGTSTAASSPKGDSGGDYSALADRVEAIERWQEQVMGELRIAVPGFMEADVPSVAPSPDPAAPSDDDIPF